MFKFSSGVLASANSTFELEYQSDANIYGSKGSIKVWHTYIMCPMKYQLWSFIFNEPSVLFIFEHLDFYMCFVYLFQVCDPFWCPTEITVNSEVESFPIPFGDISTNFENSAGLQYEAEEVRHCIMNGTRYFCNESVILISDIFSGCRKAVFCILFRSLDFHAQICTTPLR